MSGSSSRVREHLDNVTGWARFHARTLKIALAGTLALAALAGGAVIATTPDPAADTTRPGATVLDLARDLEERAGAARERTDRYASLPVPTGDPKIDAATCDPAVEKVTDLADGKTIGKVSGKTARKVSWQAYLVGAYCTPERANQINRKVLRPFYGE